MNSLHKSVSKFGTVAFDIQLMEELIFIGSLIEVNGEVVRTGTPLDLCLILWMNIVPEVYRDSVLDIVYKIFPDYKGLKATRPKLDAFIAHLNSKIFEELEPAKRNICEDW